MFKFMLIFNKPTNLEKFENSYNDLLALVERMPDITRRQVINVVGSPLGDSRIYRILEVYFDDQAKMEESLRSLSGQEAGAEISRFPAKSFELIFAEVYEEAGATTEASATADPIETAPASEPTETKD
jgi:uncharacterized protein (TIGR02118 family)